MRQNQYILPSKNLQTKKDFMEMLQINLASILNGTLTFRFKKHILKYVLYDYTIFTTTQIET